MIESLKRQFEINDRVGAEIEVNRCGILYLADSDANLARHEQ
tara:strand:- start:278 stop:403 length:126 start_codon:yes stop_codon:yes gene_type:complete